LSSAYLIFDGVTKHFPGVNALQEVSFAVKQGSVHALLGENGAGKSTLLKAISGAHPLSAGRILLDGEATHFRNTADAIAAGVAVIYQELHLIPEMSVAENLLLGHYPSRLGVVNRKRLLAEARNHLARLGEAIDPSTRLGNLSIGQRQMVEIAKALSRGARIIAFDEPTSSLSAREIGKLFQVIRELKQQGKVILYVTHRMEEVFELCDSATVLRDGRHVVTWDSLQGITRDRVVSSMVGRDIQDIYSYTSRPIGGTILQVDQLLGAELNEPVSLEIRRGEIVGIFGLIGAGRSELLKLIYGDARATSGTIHVDGKAMRIASPRQAVRSGVVLCPEDRKKEGIFPVRSVRENLNISARRNHLMLRLVTNERWEQSNCRRFIERLSIRTAGERQLIMNLSGGNQQKVILGRWLSEDVKVILLDEPTRGIDVGAKSEIYRIIHELAQNGVGIVMVSSDLPEVLGVTDRVLVMRQGRISGELSRKDATAEKVLTLALPVGV
jgi:L-arabinose transport system ATP-binding protein